MKSLIKVILFLLVLTFGHSVFADDCENSDGKPACYVSSIKRAVGGQRVLGMELIFELYDPENLTECEFLIPAGTQGGPMSGPAILAAAEKALETGLPIKFHVYRDGNTDGYCKIDSITIGRN